MSKTKTTTLKKAVASAVRKAAAKAKTLNAKAPTPKPNKMIEASKRRAAEREKERIAADAKLQTEQSAAVKSLTPLAKEANAFLDMASRSEDQAYDRRLSAALKLEEARKIAEKAKINFKKWCEDNITQSYETVRKLVAVGSSKNPKQALEDLRNRNKKANKKLRAKKAQALAAPTETPYIRAEKALAAMKDKDQHTFLDSKAKKMGFRVIAEGDAKVLEQAKRGDAPAPAPATESIKPGDPIQALQAAFMALKAGQMMAFMHWAAKRVDGTFTANFDTGEDGLDIPPALDRRAKVAAGRVERGVAKQ